MYALHRMNPNIIFGKATLKDADSIRILLDSDNNVGSKTDEWIASNIRDFFVVKAGMKIIGCIALHFLSVDRAYLESLIVKKEFRGEGIGSRLVELALKEAKLIGAKEVIAFSSSPAFLEKSEFKVVSKAEIGVNNCREGCVPMLNDLKGVE